MLHRRYQAISTHSLTKGLTESIERATDPVKFQLTASRRGWREIRKPTIRRKYFNSQPHEEADSSVLAKGKIPDVFQLTASRRGWRRCDQFIDQSHRYFNSQPHEEADGNFRQKYIYLKLFFTLIAHINLVFYSNHYIVNFFLVKYTHFLVRMSWSISVSLPFAL